MILGMKVAQTLGKVMRATKKLPEARDIRIAIWSSYRVAKQFKHHNNPYYYDNAMKSCCNFYAMYEELSSTVPEWPKYQAELAKLESL